MILHNMEVLENNKLNVRQQHTLAARKGQQYPGLY